MNLTERGKLALRQIENAIRMASDELDKLGAAARAQDAPLFQQLRKSTD